MLNRIKSAKSCEIGTVTERYKESLVLDHRQSDQSMEHAECETGSCHSETRGSTWVHVQSLCLWSHCNNSVVLQSASHMFLSDFSWLELGLSCACHGLTVSKCLQMLWQTLDAPSLASQLQYHVAVLTDCNGHCKHGAAWKCCMCLSSQPIVSNNIVILPSIHYR